jgi:hypothetical protein
MFKKHDKFLNINLLNKLKILNYKSFRIHFNYYSLMESSNTATKKKVKQATGIIFIYDYRTN